MYMTNPELFVPDNYLELCQGLQEVIASVSPDEQDIAGAKVREMAGKAVYFGEKKLEVRTLGAYALPDGLTMESDVWPTVSFGAMRLRGELAQLAYARVGRVRSLMWMMVEPKVREASPTPSTNIFDAEVARLGYKNDVLRRPLYLPVGMIESVIIAA